MSTSTSSEIHLPRECPCTLKNLWLDIIIIFDTSNEVRSDDFYELRGHIIDFITQINISQSEGMTSRIAFLNVATDAQRIGNLTSYQSSVEAITELSEIEFRGETDFNLAAGLVEARRILDESDSRSSVKNLVIVFTNKDIQCSEIQLSQKKVSIEEDPCRIASHMIEDPATILMSVALKFAENEDFPNLKFSSPCFSTNNDINFMNSFTKLVCQANCFCEHQYIRFLSEHECLFYGECVYPKGIASPFLPAQLGCQFDGTKLVDVFSPLKDSFLKDIAIKYTQIPYWIGLQKVDGKFTWDTGVQLSLADYTNWGPDEPNLSAGNCVYVKQSTGFNAPWFMGPCSWEAQSYYYFCQKNTCDTDNYCTHS